MQHLNFAVILSTVPFLKLISEKEGRILLASLFESKHSSLIAKTGMNNFSNFEITQFLLA